jgi:SERTA motif
MRAKEIEREREINKINLPINMTLPELSEQHYREDEELSENDGGGDDADDIFGSTRTFTFRAKNKLSMISNELRMREKRKRVLQMCLRKLERIKDSENNLRISVIIHNTYSRLTADIKRDKLRGQNKYQQQQYQNK